MLADDTDGSENLNMYRILSETGNGILLCWNVGSTDKQIWGVFILKYHTKTVMGGDAHMCCSPG
jgi:hypothetical protein